MGNEWGISKHDDSCPNPHRTVQQGGQFVLLGSGHSDGVFKGLASGEFKDHPDCRYGVGERDPTAPMPRLMPTPCEPSPRLMVMYSERLAHMIYAAADIVLVPSMFEPCGLTQMIALR